MANVIERAQAERKYNHFVKGVQSVVGLVETLNGPGPFTIFVPTDAAFERLSSDKRSKAASVGTKKVKGPGPLRVSTSPPTDWTPLTN